MYGRCGYGHVPPSKSCVGPTLQATPQRIKHLSKWLTGYPVTKKITEKATGRHMATADQLV